jgi:hypothetical protein
MFADNLEERTNLTKIICGTKHLFDLQCNDIADKLCMSSDKLQRIRINLQRRTAR